MSAYAMHQSGDCNPWTCPVCLNTCDVCGHLGLPCLCPTLPLDDEEES